MKITVCIGSSCHLKGSRQIVETLRYLVSENGLKDRVDLEINNIIRKSRTEVN